MAGARMKYLRMKRPRMNPPRMKRPMAITMNTAMEGKRTKMDIKKVCFPHEGSIPFLKLSIESFFRGIESFFRFF